MASLIKKAKRVWSRKPEKERKPVKRSKTKAKKADTKASAGTQMSDEELEAQARVHGVVRTSVAAHGGLGAAWNLDDLPNPDPPPPPELSPEEALAAEGRVRAAALGGAGPELVLEKPRSKAKD